MLPDSFPELQPPGQLLRNHLLGVIAENHVDFVCGRIEVVQQPLRIQGSAGSSDGNKKFHNEFRRAQYDPPASAGQVVSLVT